MKNKDFVYKVVNMDRTSYASEKGSKYSLKYPKDGIVEAIPGSLGLMCFTNKKNARAFINKDFFDGGIGCFIKMMVYKILFFNSPDNLDYYFPIIIKVKPLSEGSLPMLICNRFNNYRYDEFYEGRRSQFNTCVPPKGTVCYDKIKVLT
jgi:hypothetical protein